MGRNPGAGRLQLVGKGAVGTHTRALEGLAKEGLQGRKDGVSAH